MTQVPQSHKPEVGVDVFSLQASKNCVSPTRRYLTSLGFSVFFFHYNRKNGSRHFPASGDIVRINETPG